MKSEETEIPDSHENGDDTRRRLELTAFCQGCGGMRSAVREDKSSETADCPDCDSLLVQIREIRGIVYVLSNPVMPGLLKIGMTTRNVQERLAELSSGTSVPAPFVIEAWFDSDNPEQDESEIQDRLKAFRLNNREFFTSGLDEVLKICAEQCGRGPAHLRPRQRPEDLEDDLLERKERIAIVLGDKFFCPRCRSRMRALKGRRGWACKGCRIFVDHEGNSL